MSLWREICVRLDKYYFAHHMTCPYESEMQLLIIRKVG